MWVGICHQKLRHHYHIHVLLLGCKPLKSAESLVVIKAVNHAVVIITFGVVKATFSYLFEQCQ